MATNTFVGVPQPDSAHKPLLNLVDSARVGSRTSHGATLFVLAPRTLTSAGGGKRCGRFRDRSPAEAAPSASIKRKDRDRADSLAEEGPIGFPAERAARIQFALVLISILDYETNSQSTPAANLF